MTRMTNRKRTIAKVPRKIQGAETALATFAARAPIVKPKLRPASKGRVHKGKTGS